MKIFRPISHFSMKIFRPISQARRIKRERRRRRERPRHFLFQLMPGSLIKHNIMQFGPYTVDVKNREKIYFPEAGISKGDLIEYYDKIADSLLPFIKDRPLTLRRFPDGISEEGFYQKEMPDYFPDWIPSAEIKKKDGGTLQQIICNNKATLVYLVNQGTIGFHPW